MTDRPFRTDPGEPVSGRQIDSNPNEDPYWQAGYRLGGYDQRIADLQEIRTRLTGADNGPDPVEVERRQQLLDQLQADLLETENARAAYLQNLDAYLDELEAERTRQLDNADATQDRSALSSEVIGAWRGYASPGTEVANTPVRAGGVVRSPRTPDSTHRAHQAQAPAATLRPHP